MYMALTELACMAVVYCHIVLFFKLAERLAVALAVSARFHHCLIFRAGSQFCYM